MNNSKILIDILGAGFGIYLTILFYQSIWDSKNLGKWKWIFGILVVGIAHIVSIYFLQETYFLPLLSFLVLIFLSFYFISSIQFKLLFSVAYFVMAAIAEIITGLTLYQLTDLSVSDTQKNMLTYFMGVFISKFIIFIAIKIIYYFKREKHQGSNKFAIAMIFSPLYSLILAFIIYIVAYDSNDRFIIILCMISMVVMVIANIFIFYIIENQIKSERLNQYFNYSKQQLEDQIDHYNELYEAQKETRKIRHDIKNNLLAIGSLISRNKVIEAQSYIEKITGEIQITEITPDSQTPLIDAIIHAKIKEAAKHQIKINYSIRVSEKVDIDFMELAIILTSAIDNAIESTIEVIDQDLKVINIYIHQELEYLSIQIDNPTNNRLDVNQLTTSKKDKQNHGFGLQQIKTITRKYEGSTDFDFDEKSKLFKLSLLLRNMKA